MFLSRRSCFSTLTYGYEATDNHQQINNFFQERKADKAEETGTSPCPDEAAKEAECPKGEGGFGKETDLQTKKSVEDIEREEEGL